MSEGAGNVWRLSCRGAKVVARLRKTSCRTCIRPVLSAVCSTPVRHRRRCRRPPTPSPRWTPCCCPPWPAAPARRTSTPTTRSTPPPTFHRRWMDRHDNPTPRLVNAWSHAGWVEIATTLACSTTTASHLVELGVALRERLPKTRAAFAAGQIDYAKAWRLATATAGFGTDATAAAETAALGFAHRYAPAGFTTAIEDVLIRTAPDEYAQLRKDAEKRARRVRRRKLGLLDRIEADLTAPEAAAVWQRLREVAATVCAPRPPRRAAAPRGCLPGAHARRGPPRLRLRTHRLHRRPHRGVAAHPAGAVHRRPGHRARVTQRTRVPTRARPDRSRPGPRTRAERHPATDPHRTRRPRRHRRPAHPRTSRSRHPQPADAERRHREPATPRTPTPVPTHAATTPNRGPTPTPMARSRPCADAADRPDRGEPRAPGTAEPAESSLAPRRRAAPRHRWKARCAPDCATRAWQPSSRADPGTAPAFSPPAPRRPSRSWCRCARPSLRRVHRTARHLPRIRRRPAPRRTRRPGHPATRGSDLPAQRRTAARVRARDRHCRFPAAPCPPRNANSTTSGPSTTPTREAGGWTIEVEPAVRLRVPP